jgi:aspartyl/glutamyl-tRNA(Asn/Gln) amidotransferase C subunit
MIVKHQGTKKIETRRLILRQFTLNDAEPMYRNWASDGEVTRYLTWTPHESVEETKSLLKEWIDDYKKPEKYEWCIELKEIGEPIGSIGVVGIREKIGAMEIGYCISEAYWHQGITSEAFEAVIAYLTKEVGARRIESRHDTRNPYSGKVMEKCGLKYEGTKIQGDWNNSGICDCAFYGMVLEDVAVVEEEEEDVFVVPAPVKKPGEKNIISDETIEYVGILAKLELSDEEKERAKKDMGDMLDYIDKLNELDTTGVEPMSHVFPVNNVFREDVVTNGDGSKETLANAPAQKDGGFKVPKTIG